ncbi:hypothetical protein KY311_02880, partial [Candidatus Woesearchaeota archaeon]|nr:hypothetical protein [Candidatus Woesearchaeota archaeon]
LSRVQYQGNKKGIVMNITVTNVTIYHVTPWVVNVTGSFVINVSDSMSTAKWGREMQSTSQINIKGFEDPLYVIYSYGRVTNFVNITPYSGDYTSGANATFDPSNLLSHTLNSLYTNNSNAPSFLMRLENNLSSSPYGIESLVNVGFFESQGAPVYDKSVVDYIYFSNSSDPASHQINEMPNWFRLDDAHLVLYQVDGETI